ncbi:MAG: hypothetical protein AB1568_14180 [Thermodesulfobacteriota bacterium]
MESPLTIEFDINLRFEAIKLPPVTDILVLGKRYPHGKNGILKAFQYIAPDEFQFVDLPESHQTVEAILVSRRISRRLPIARLVDILEQHVFPFISEEEAVKVDLSIVLHSKNIKGEV